MTEVEQVLSRAKRGRIFFGAAIAVICAAALGAALFAVVVNLKQDRAITRVTQKVESACAIGPASAECQTIKRQGDRARSIRDTCIAFWKVGYSCPRPGSIAAEREVQANSKSVQNLETGNSGGVGEQPGQGGIGGGPAPDNPGSGKSPAPQDPGADPDPAPAQPPTASPTTPPATAPVVDPPAAPPVTPTSDPIRSTVEDVGDTVRGTVCSLPLQLCP